MSPCSILRAMLRQNFVPQSSISKLHTRSLKTRIPRIFFSTAMSGPLFDMDTDTKIMDTAARLVNDDELFISIRSLPQELKDMILSHAFKHPATITINTNYKIPIPLALNCAIRAQTAKDYYGSTTFECKFHSQSQIEHFEYGGWEKHYFVDWIRSLTETHKAMIKRVQITLPSPGVPDQEARAYRTRSAVAWPLIKYGLGHVKVIVGFVQEGGRLDRYGQYGFIRESRVGKDV